MGREKVEQFEVERSESPLLLIQQSKHCDRSDQLIIEHQGNTRGQSRVLVYDFSVDRIDDVALAGLDDFLKCLRGLVDTAFVPLLCGIMNSSSYAGCCVHW